MLLMPLPPLRLPLLKLLRLPLLKLLLRPLPKPLLRLPPLTRWLPRLPQNRPLFRECLSERPSLTGRPFSFCGTEVGLTVAIRR